MKVTNMTSNKGNKIANQFIIEDGSVRIFLSYDSVIAMKKPVLTTVPIFDNVGKCMDTRTETRPQVYLDANYWDYSVTTGKYRNQFLGETKKETQAKIDSGEYILTDLNK